MDTMGGAPSPAVLARRVPVAVRSRRASTSTSTPRSRARASRAPYPAPWRRRRARRVRASTTRARRRRSRLVDDDVDDDDARRCAGRRHVVGSSSRRRPAASRALASSASGRDRTRRPRVGLNGYTRTIPIPSTSLDSRTSPSTPDAPRPTSRDPIRARRRRVGVVASARHSARPGQRALERPNARSARDGSERTESAPSDRARHAHRRARVRDDDDVEREV